MKKAVELVTFSDGGSIVIFIVWWRRQWN